VPKKYPSIGEVLPIVTGHGVKPHVTVALDLTVLARSPTRWARPSSR
jgi:hypothetical protein